MQYESKRLQAIKVTVISAAFVAISAPLAGCLSGPLRKASTPIVRESASAGVPTTCGNGAIDPGETCEKCPADCHVPSCEESGDEVKFSVRLEVPFGDSATSITTLVGYDGTLMRIPGGGMTPETQKRIRNRPKGASTYATVLGPAVRVVQTKNDGFPSAEIYSVVLDRCEDARDTTAADLTCTVEGCAGKFGLIDGCSCSLVPSRGLDVSDLRSKQE